MNQSSSFKWHHFFTYFLLGAIVGYMLRYAISFTTSDGRPLVTFKHPFTPPDITLTLLTLAGACGGVLYAMRSKKLELPHKTDGMINPGWLGDCFFGVAGAYVISLIMPGEFPSDLTNPQAVTSNRVELTIQVLATGIIGGYGGRSIIDRALDNIFRRQDELEDKVQSNSNVLKEVKGEAQSGAEALVLLERHLDKDVDAANEDVEKLQQAIKAASPSIKDSIFLDAKKVRAINVLKKDLEMIKRTIPVFEALVESDTENKYHRNHAQLGYAFKDKEPPDWTRAEAEFSKAIEIRDKLPGKHQRFWFYEFNRAICRIELDANFKQGQLSLPNVRDKVLQDLQTVSQSETLAKLDKAKQDESTKEEVSKCLEQIVKWLKQNNLSTKGFEPPTPSYSHSQVNGALT